MLFLRAGSGAGAGADAGAGTGADAGADAGGVGLPVLGLPHHHNGDFAVAVTTAPFGQINHKSADLGPAHGAIEADAGGAGVDPGGQGHGVGVGETPSQQAGAETLSLVGRQDGEEAHEEVCLAVHVALLRALERAEEVVGQGGIAVGGDVEGRVQVRGLRRWVDLPAAVGDDLACGWQEGFDRMGAGVTVGECKVSGCASRKIVLSCCCCCCC